MGARSGNRTLMDLARERARRYLRALPARDRVMLVRADALATPATGFEPDRRKLEAAIRDSQPGSTALNLEQALAFARHIQAEAGGRTGEIVFVGCGRTTAERRSWKPRRAICACCWCPTPSKTPACARSACAAPPATRTFGRSTSRRAITAPRRAT